MVGCGVGILLSLKGTMNRVLEEKTTGLYSRFSQNELLRLSLLGALPIGIGGALLPTVPPELPARMILGAFWGFYVAAGVLVFTWLIERESISDARLYIVTVEIELLFFMLIFIFGSLFGTHVNLNKIFEGPELIIPASVVCIVTYLVAYVCSSWARE
jgi:hypothetical protein